MAQRRRGLGAGAAVGVVVALGLLAWMFTGGEPQVKRASEHSAGAASHDGVAKKKPKKKSKKKKKKPSERLAIAGPFASRDACQKAIEGRKARPATAPVRIGSWNIRWFPRGGVSEREKKPTDLDWLACAIASLEVDVLAIQEILQDPAGRTALLAVQSKLDELTGGKWQSDTDDCPGGGRQHVGLLYDSSRVKVSDLHELPALNPQGESCSSNLRPGFGARVQLPGGRDLQIVSVHLDSGETMHDHDNRVRSAAALPTVTAAAKRNQGTIVLGDFNTMGCKDCTPQVPALGELAELDAAAAAAGLQRLAPRDGEARVCTHYLGGKPSWLDQILVSKASVDLTTTAHMELAGACAAMACRGVKKGLGRPLAFEKLSDHCPVVVELGPADAAASAGKPGTDAVGDKALAAKTPAVPKSAAVTPKPAPAAAAPKPAPAAAAPKPAPAAAAPKPAPAAAP